MNRQKTQNQVTHTQVKNTKRKPVTALKKKKMKITCQSKILIRISTGKWDLAIMKKKKAVGRNRRMKRETDVRTAVVAGLEKGMATIATATNPSTRQILMRGKGAERGTEAEVQRNPKIKKNPSTDEQRGGRWNVVGLPGQTWGVQPLSVPACTADCGLHVSIVAFQGTLMVWGSGREGAFYVYFFIQILLLCILGNVHS